MFLETGTPLKLTLSDTPLRKKLILLNASKDNPQGSGYIVEKWPVIHRTEFKVARDMWMLLTPRIDNLEKRGIFNERIRSLQQEGTKALETAEAALDDKRNALGRQELAVISRQSEVERHVASRQQLEARLQRHRARLTEAQLALERSRVIAPFDGIVSMLGVTVGNQVRANDVVLEMYSLDRLEIRATVPVIYQQELIAATTEGNRYPAVSGDIELQLDRLSGQAGTAGIDALFAIETGSEKLRLGQQLTILLLRPEQPDLAMLPFQALYGNDRIYRINDEERLETLVVEQVGSLFHEGREMMLVRSDELEDGDRIVSTHLPNAVQGLKVSVVE